MRPGSRFARATRGRNMGRQLAPKRPMLAGLMIEALNVFATDSIHFGVSAPHTGASPFPCIGNTAHAEASEPQYVRDPAMRGLRQPLASSVGMLR